MDTYRRLAPRCLRTHRSDFCAVAPSPELKERLQAGLAQARDAADPAIASLLSLARNPRPLGFNDGVIVPPENYPVGTALAAIRDAAAERAPLRGAVRVVVVLVQFSDKALHTPVSRFQDLFFSTGKLPHGSVKEYYREVTGGLVDIVGEVAGPFTLPQTLAWYANGNFGIGKPTGVARANIMANDAANAANPTVNFGNYDNDGNGFVDAFIVVHAGSGGEQTGNSGDIWSHKWTLPTALNADGKQVYAYLTIPEDARLGVCAHELGHLLFGFPDLYDTDYTSEGIGNWCLMSGGSWNGGGDIPAHPSAWCKANQGWASVTNVTTATTLSLPDVKTSRTVHRLWKDGTGGNEYFLLENRQRTGFDAGLPGDGLLVWHIDESQPGNTDESHYKVALMQADAKRDLELDHNRGDAGDPYPAAGNATFTGASTPGSNSYAQQRTCVSITGISASGPVMSARVGVHCKSLVKDLKDARKETKELAKESKDLKDTRKETKEAAKDLKEARKEVKEFKEVKEASKELKERTEGKQWTTERKSPKETVERPGGGTGGGGDPGVGSGADESMLQWLSMLDARLSALESQTAGADGAAAGGQAQAFIDPSLRPELAGATSASAAGDVDVDLQSRMAGGDRDAKRAFDTAR